MAIFENLFQEFTFVQFTPGSNLLSFQLQYLCVSRFVCLILQSHAARPSRGWRCIYGCGGGTLNVEHYGKARRKLSTTLFDLRIDFSVYSTAPLMSRQNPPFLPYEPGMTA